MEKKLPDFKPLPELGNVASNYMSAFNVGMNIYEALAYLQGYVQITYNSVNDLIDDWNNFENYVTENINQIANEKTQQILNQWLEDGTLNELIATNPQWALKVNKAGDVMSGDLQFQENTGVYGTLHSGTKVNMISHSYTGTDDYTQIGDDNAQAVIHSKNRPVWYDGSQNQDLLVEEDLTDISNITNHNVNVVQSLNYRCLGQTFVRKTIQYISYSTHSTISIDDIFPNFKDNSNHSALVFIGPEGFAQWKDSNNWSGTLPVNYANGSSDYTLIRFSPKEDHSGYEISIYRGNESRHVIIFDVYCSTSNLT